MFYVNLFMVLYHLVFFISFLFYFFKFAFCLDMLIPFQKCSHLMRWIYLYNYLWIKVKHYIDKRFLFVIYLIVLSDSNPYLHFLFHSLLFIRKQVISTEKICLFNFLLHVKKKLNLFYIASLLRTWPIIALHKFLSFVGFSKVRLIFAISPNFCSGNQSVIHCFSLSLLRSMCFVCVKLLEAILP